MTEVRLSVDDVVWDGYKATVSHDQTLDEPIKKEIAERVAGDDRVPPEARRRAEQLLEERWD